MKKQVRQAQNVVEKLEQCAKQRALADADTTRYAAQLREETKCAKELEDQLVVSNKNNEHLRGVEEDSKRFAATDNGGGHVLWESCENVVE